MKSLRPISLTVIELTPGFFYWQLLEAVPSKGDSWIELQRSSSAYREWIEAFNEGVNQVFSLTGDGRFGPR